MCNSHQLTCTSNGTPSRTAKHVQHPHQVQAHHVTSSPTGVMDVHHQIIFHPYDDKQQSGSGAKDAGSSEPDDQYHDCKEKLVDSSRPPSAHQHAVPRSISITSSNVSSTTTSAADRTDEALLDRHDSSSSLSSLSSFGSINENPPAHPQIKPSLAPAPASAPSKTDECKSPISPRRAIFDAYWKRSPSSTPAIRDSSKDEVGVDGPVATKPAVSLPPPPPLVQVDDDATAKAFFGIVDDSPTREYQPEARRNGSLSDILEGLFGIIPPITTTTSPSTSPKPSIKSTTSPKSHLTRTGLMLAHQASCGSSSRRSTGTPPTSPQTPRPKVPISPATSPSSASPLPSCLRQGSRRATRKHSQDEERTCGSTPSSSSERLSHISTNRKAPVVRVRSNSTVSFCPNVHIIEFDNSREMRDEEIIRSPRAKKEGNAEDWNAWFAV